MLNREMRTVEVLTFANTVDAYGQKRQSTATSTNSQMAVKIYSQSNVNDPRYVDIDMIGITKDTSISTENQIKIDDKVFNVLYVIPSTRYYQILMKKA